MKQTLTNDLLSVTIDSHGAELQNITARRTGYEYLWHGDPEFWKRRSPVLFPIVGSLWNGTCRVDGKEYHMSQHGFARDREFTPLESDDPAEAWFALEADDQSLALFPRRFRLEIGYRLEDTRIAVMWRVANLDTLPMSFQIGAHPAFNYPEFNAADPVHCYFAFNTRDLATETIAGGGCVGPDILPVGLDAEGMLAVGADTFLNDALIFTHGKVNRVSMLDKERQPYLTVLFRSPAVGLWAPKPTSPFVCIEPWWGRCDRLGYEGEFSGREYVNTIGPGATFEACYTVIIDNI